MMRPIVILTLAASLAGCILNPAAVEEQAIANKAIVRGYMEEVLNGRDCDQWDRYVAQPAIFNGSEISKDWCIALTSSFRAAFPDFRISIEAQVAAGDLVATCVTFRGTHRGEFRGIAATGRQIEFTGIALDRIEDGKVVEMWHEADNAGLLAQIRNGRP